MGFKTEIDEFFHKRDKLKKKIEKLCDAKYDITRNGVFFTNTKNYIRLGSEFVCNDSNIAGIVIDEIQKLIDVLQQELESLESSIRLSNH